ncbi:hypothetical protein HS088_TW04G01530 [Tripterygium wilfordii]|uniref:Uncharacterized protein n=1 Tax=Tripterygium wilfordii TaxID=458696 RepID=A0A7J7DTC5_TRIWF|nr:hypothetical protein HS088_TW04G01530 [Tripterygium wilfordii]
MGGGKRRPRNKTDNRKSSGGSSGGGGNRSRGKASSNSSRNSLFVVGGVLSDWAPTHSPVGNADGGLRSGSRSGNADRPKAASRSKSGAQKFNGNIFGYQYPSANDQEGFLPESLVTENGGEKDLDESRPIVVVDSDENQIVAYLDQTPQSEPQNVEFSYDYGSTFVLGESLPRGLGFSDDFQTTRSGIGSSSKLMEVEDQEGSGFDSFVSGEKMDDDQTNIGNEFVETGAELQTKVFSSKKNSAFVSIGGMKLFTQDLSDEDSDEDDDGESLDDENSDTSELKDADKFSESDDSVDFSTCDSDIDREVAEDYLEGIGGSDNILDSKFLVGQVLDDNDSDDDCSSSSGCFDDTVEKLGGIALQDFSREYGMKKPRSKKKYPVAARDSQSSALDDLVLVKDPRTVYAKKKHVPQFPRSWPLEAQKSKRSRNFPGKVVYLGYMHFFPLRWSLIKSSSNCQFISSAGF